MFPTLAAWSKIWNFSFVTPSKPSISAKLWTSLTNFVKLMALPFYRNEKLLLAKLELEWPNKFHFFFSLSFSFFLFTFIFSFFFFFFSFFFFLFSFFFFLFSFFFFLFSFFFFLFSFFFFLFSFFFFL